MLDEYFRVDDHFTRKKNYVNFLTRGFVKFANETNNCKYWEKVTKADKAVGDLYRCLNDFCYRPIGQSNSRYTEA